VRRRAVADLHGQLLSSRASAHLHAGLALRRRSQDTLEDRAASGVRHETLITGPRAAIGQVGGHQPEHIQAHGARRDERRADVGKLLLQHHTTPRMQEVSHAELSHAIA
jgi:hypothetical protein